MEAMPLPPPPPPPPRLPPKRSVHRCAYNPRWTDEEKQQLCCWACQPRIDRNLSDRQVWCAPLFSWPGGGDARVPLSPALGGRARPRECPISCSRTGRSGNGTSTPPSTAKSRYCLSAYLAYWMPGLLPSKVSSISWSSVSVFCLSVDDPRGSAASGAAMQLGSQRNTRWTASLTASSTSSMAGST
jgi:hypothetical protein